MVGIVLGGVLAVAIGACGSADDDPPRSTGPATSVGVGGFGAAPATGACEGDEIQECKVWLDENNCFVGEQQCVEGEWGPCVEPESLDQTALGGASGCPMNPCNPGCQEYNEDAMPDLEAAGTPPPPVGFADVSSIPSSFRNACLNDSNSGCGDCTSTGYCQFDTVCVSTVCEPWGVGEEVSNPPAPLTPATPMKPDYTIKPVCDKSRVPVCNRGDVAGGMGVVISKWNTNTANCGGNGCQGAPKTGIPGMRVMPDCIVPTDIAPGDCIEVDCSDGNNGSLMYHINGADEAGAAFDGNENDEDNNWGYYNHSLPCTCSAASQTGTLGNVTMFLMLDDSGSMDNLPGNQPWTGATSAVSTFINDPGSTGIRFGMATYTSPGPNCQCNSSGCDDPALTAGPNNAPELLSNATYRMNVDTWLGMQSPGGGTPHIPTIQGMADWATAWRMSNPTDTIALVYITDGKDGDCGFNLGDDPVPVAAPAGTAASPPTNALFFTVALPQANTVLMDEVAKQGGTGKAIDLTGSTNVDADLTMELQNIGGSLNSCNITIQNPMNVDPTSTVVTWMPSMGPPVTLTKVMNNDPMNCSAAAEFYFLPDDINPTSVELCPTYCGTVQGDPTGTLEMTASCAGGFVPQTFVFEYVGDCSGYPNGSHAVWDYLTYETTTGEGNVEFRINTSNVDAMTAAAGPFTLLAATATPADEDAIYPGDPVDLRSLLGPLAQQQYLALEITVNPGANATPIVHDWGIQYSCEYNE